MDNMDKTAAEVLQGMIYGIEATYGRLYIWSVMEVTDKSHLSSFLGLVHNNGKRTRDEKCGQTTICDLYSIKRLWLSSLEKKSLRIPPAQLSLK